MPNRLENIPPEHWERAKELRRSATSAERKLWLALRSGKQGERSRRQHPVGPYIVDFYCWDRRLIIELDGPSHHCLKAEAYDTRRDEYCRALGFRVLRYSNQQVLERFDSVPTGTQNALNAL